MDRAPGSLGDRRRSSRLHALDPATITCRVRPGRDAIVLDVSSAGALIETASRLLPGTMIELHIERGEHRWSGRARVLRASVGRLQASRVWYRGAVGFEHRVAWLDGQAAVKVVPAVEHHVLVALRGAASSGRT